MTIMNVAQVGNHVLQYDTEDVETVGYAIPHDVIDTTPPGAQWARHELGQATMTLTVRFKPGKCPRWVLGDTSGDC